MSILRKCNFLKLAAIFMLLSITVGGFGAHTKTAVAAPAGACSTTTIIFGSSGTPTSCDMTISATVAEGLTFTSSGVTVNTPMVIGINHFTFDTVVTDTRLTSAAGWRLEALSATGLTIGNTPIPIQIDGTGGNAPLTSGTCTPITGGDCGTSVYDTAILGALALPIVTTSIVVTKTNTVGVYTISGKGSFDVPSNTPAGAYGGTITLSLVPSAT